MRDGGQGARRARGTWASPFCWWPSPWFSRSVQVGKFLRATQLGEKTLQESRCLDGYPRERTGAGSDCATRLRAQRAFRGQICWTKPDQCRRERTQVRV